MKLYKSPLKVLDDELSQIEVACCGCRERFIIEADETTTIIVGPTHKGATETEVWGILCHQCSTNNDGHNEFMFAE